VSQFLKELFQRIIQEDLNDKIMKLLVFIFFITFLSLSCSNRLIGTYSNKPHYSYFIHLDGKHSYSCWWIGGLSPDSISGNYYIKDNQIILTPFLGKNGFVTSTECLTNKTFSIRVLDVNDSNAIPFTKVYFYNKSLLVLELETDFYGEISYSFGSLNFDSIFFEHPSFFNQSFHFDKNLCYKAYLGRNYEHRKTELFFVKKCSLIAEDGFTLKKVRNRK
jgi:hypothetical protein